MLHGKKATQWCPCGWYGTPGDRCECTPREVARYRARLSGPLLDRFDLRVHVPAVDVVTLAGTSLGEASESVRPRVLAARERQRSRFGPGGPACNARMGPAELRRHAVFPPGFEGEALELCRRFGVTARGFDRIRRVARTLADLEGSDRLRRTDFTEALGYRIDPTEPV